eukprot:589741-Pyramimonas_sp.AAC.2
MSGLLRQLATMLGLGEHFAATVFHRHPALRWVSTAGRRGPGTAAGYVIESNDEVRTVVLDVGNKVFRKGVESTASRDRDIDSDPAVQALTRQLDRLSDEVRRLSDNRSITVVNRNGSSNKMSYVIVPVTVRRFLYNSHPTLKDGFSNTDRGSTTCSRRYRGGLHAIWRGVEGVRTQFGGV